MSAEVLGYNESTQTKITSPMRRTAKVRGPVKECADEDGAVDNVFTNLPMIDVEVDEDGCLLMPGSEEDWPW